MYSLVESINLNEIDPQATTLLAARIAGSDGGGEHWAIVASLIETCKMNDVDPESYLRDVLTKIVARHPMSRIDELFPFTYSNCRRKRKRPRPENTA